MRKTRSLEQWRSIIEEQQASDLTERSENLGGLPPCWIV